MSHQVEANYFQVKDLSPLIARVQIKQAIKDAMDLNVYIPSRRRTDNLMYASGRVCMKSRNKLKLSKASPEKCERMYALLHILLDLNTKNKFLAKRGIFYKNKELFISQRESDLLIDDACCILRATRRSLRIKASPKGLVIGSIVIRENGKNYNLQNFDILGKTISPYMSNFDVISCDAKFILVVEKETTYASLIEDEFHKKVRCIIITGKGMPDMATRYFLRNLTNKLKNRLPVLALVDCDPYGIQIMSTYTCGSDNLAFDSENLVTPNIKWLGLRPTDPDKYKLDLSGSTTELSDKERSVVEGLTKKNFIVDKPSWVTEIGKILESGRTCDLGALNSKLVLRKVAEKNWLPGIGDVGT